MYAAAEGKSNLGIPQEVGKEFISSDAEFREQDHPRDADGKFGSSGGSAKLNATERSQVSSYTGDAFLDLNKKLRSGDAGGKLVSDLDGAVSKGRIPEGTKLYRGMSREAAKQLFGGQINRGDEIEDKAFLSTSSDPSVVSTSYGFGGVMMEITTGSDQRGIDVSEMSRNPNEKEFLLPRNTKLKVTGVIPPKKLGDPVIVRVTT